MSKDVESKTDLSKNKHNEETNVCVTLYLKGCACICYEYEVGFMHVYDNCH